MKKMIAPLLMVAVVLSGLNVSRVQSEAAENNPTNEVQIENPEQSTNEWNNQRLCIFFGFSFISLYCCPIKLLSKFSCC